MKKVLRILAVVVALVLVTAAIPAHAASSYSITVNSAKDGATYTAYKMFDLSVNSDLTSYVYTVNSNWASFFGTGGAGAEFVEIDSTTGAVQIKDDKVADLAAAAAAYSSKGSGSTPATAANGSAEISVSDPGYYLIISSVGSVAMTDTTPTDPAASVDEKNILPTIEKEITGDASDGSAQIGDTIDFLITVHAQPGAANYVVTDTMDAGLSLDTTSFSVEDDNGTLTATTDYAVATTSTGFTVTFTAAYLSSITEATDIEIAYSATLTSAAATEAQGNTAKLTYGDDFDTDDTPEVTVTTYSFDLVKWKSVNDTKTLLDGATFQLFDGDTAIKFSKDTNGNYIVNAAGSADIVVTNGLVKVMGLDAGDYTLKETVVPDGYNKAADTTVTISDNNPAVVSGTTYVSGGVSVENKSGTELPSTGGTGTVVLVSVGAVLFVGMAILLVTKKRMYNED